MCRLIPFQLLIIFLITLTIFQYCSANANEVELFAPGEVDLILHDQLTFSILRSCKGNFTICYVTSNTELYFENSDKTCPPDSCILQIIPSMDIFSGVFGVTREGDRMVATFDREKPAYCPLKAINGRQRFKIIETPSCPVTVVGASLPSTETEESTTKKSSTNQPNTEKANITWIIVVIAIIVAVLLFIIGVVGLIIYKVYKAYRTPKAPQDVQPSLQLQSIQTKSPNPITAPPINTIPPKSSQVSVAPPPPMTDAVCPSVITPPFEVVSHGERIKKQKKSKPASTLTKSATKTVTAKDISPRFEMAAKYHEDSLRNLRRITMIADSTGMQSCRSGSHLDQVVLENVYGVYRTFPEYRKIVESELDFFLLITSDAMKQLPALLKSARQELCRHGAVFSHRRFCSFNKATYHFIRRTDTPGFVAWYAFALEHGSVIKIADDKEGDIILKNMSVPTLLMVVFREELEIEVRRSAFARLRRLLVQVASMHPLRELRSMFYPICLIPALIDRNKRHFLEGGDDVTFSFPFELMNQLLKYGAAEKEEKTDETQVTYSDGKQRDVMGSLVVLGTQVEPTTTVREEWI